MEPPQPPVGTDDESDTPSPHRARRLPPLPRWVRRGSRTWVAVGVVVVALVGAWLATLAVGTQTVAVGPVEVALRAVPTVGGGTDVQIPPLGSLGLSTHNGFLGLRAEVEQVDPAAARSLLDDPASISGLGDRATSDVVHGVEALVVRTLVATTLGAALLSLVVWRRWRRALAAGGVSLAVVLAGGGVAAATWEPGSIAQPTFNGLLSSAPGLVGSAQSIVTDFGKYEDQLAQIVTNVSRLYDTAENLPTFARSDDTVVVLHVSDLHLSPAAFGTIGAISKQFQADVVVDTGDLVDWGSGTEARYASGIAGLSVPYVYVAGNHDSQGTAAAVAAQPNATVLDGTTTEVAGLRFAGVRDPRFTPDQQTRSDDDQTLLPTRAAQRLAALVTSTDEADPDDPVDVALLHDPTGAEELDGVVPLVLSGHKHKRSAEELPDGTLVLTEGSTGAAGLRGLEGEDPTPVEASVLYFDRSTGQLVARDDLTLGGLGLASATIERHVLDPAADGTTGPTTTPAP